MSSNIKAMYQNKRKNKHVQIMALLLAAAADDNTIINVLDAAVVVVVCIDDDEKEDNVDESDVEDEPILLSFG